MGGKKHGQRHRQQGAGSQRGKRRLPAGPVDWALRALTVFGVLLTAYLTWSGASGEGAAFCAEDSGCDVVQGSRWSRFLGLPITFWGMLLYLAMAWTAWPGTRRLSRWQRLWRLSFWGLAISVYLTLAAWISLQAFCMWCLLSLATVTAVFVLVQWRRPEGAPGGTWDNWLLANGLVALGLVLALQASAMGLLERREDPRLRGLAEHLERSGARFYGAYWCPKCNEQKRAFGGAARRLPYVECSPNGRNGGIAFDCASAGIYSYPTWVIGGRQYTGVLSPERLAAMSGYDLERAPEQ